MWRAGRSAAGMASVLLGHRTHDAHDELPTAELETIAQLTSRIGQLRGVAMKVGQIMGYIDPTLSPQLRELLSLLQQRAPASPWPVIEQTLRDELGERAATLLSELDPTPLAVASIGQVHRARLSDGTAVAVKVQHPGVEGALRADFSNAAIGSAFARLLPGGSSVRGFVDEARAAMLEECDFTIEAARQRTFAALFAAHPSIAIPRVIDEWSTRRVLTTAWQPGRALDAFLAASPSQSERDRVGVALFELFVGTLYRHGLLHADPHPGNFAVRDDGRVVIYDFGCVRSFPRTVVDGLAHLLVAVRGDDLEAMAAALEAIGGSAPRKPSARQHMRVLLRGFFGPLLVEGPHAIEAGASLAANDVLADKRALIGLALPGSLLFLLRLRFGLYAVLARLGAVADWAQLEQRWARA